jgi:DNA polymerase-3 subunit gamma/tau
MQSRYAETAARISLSYLVSALQVITDSEMSIKGARNKRLHVELALIKLCYLQQVIDLAVNAEGKVLKKKRIDGPVAVKEKPVSPLLLKVTPASTGEAKLSIAQPPVSMQASQPLVSQPVQPASLVKESVPQSLFSDSPPPATSATAAPRPVPGKKVDLLSALKAEKMQNSMKPAEEKQVLPPDLDSVNEIWAGFVQELRDANRVAIITHFQIAQLSVIDNEVLISVPTKINQRVIESEASEILTRFKEKFNNYTITLRMEVTEREDDNREIEPRYLNSQQRFQLMAEEYPAILELKEKLKLDLGY